MVVVCWQKAKEKNSNKRTGSCNPYGDCIQRRVDWIDLGRTRIEGP